MLRPSAPSPPHDGGGSGTSCVSTTHCVVQLVLLEESEDATPRSLEWSNALRHQLPPVTGIIFIWVLLL